MPDDPKPPSAFELAKGDIPGFAWDFGDSVVLYFQPASGRGSFLQIMMTRDQFLRLFRAGQEMEGAMSVSALVEDLVPETPGAGKES